MSTTQIQQPGHIGRVLTRLLSSEGAIRRLSTQSGLSAVTLRSIAASGTVNSYVTAVALERATEGEIRADAITTKATKGSDLYRREPARSLLLQSFAEGIPISRLLGRHGLTPGDLWNFMNASPGKYEATKERVRTVLIQLNLDTDREEL